METAWVTDALVAVAAFESHSAPVVVQLEGTHRSAHSHHLEVPPPVLFTLRRIGTENLLALPWFFTVAVLLMAPGQTDRWTGRDRKLV